MFTASLSFVGAGNMAEAIARGILKAGLYKPSEMLAADPSPARRQLFESMGIAAVEGSADAARSRIVLLAVKPQSIDAALDQISPALPADALVISIVAAISTGYIASRLRGKPQVARVMPNTAMLAGAGTSALCAGEHCSAENLNVAERIFAAAGLTLRVTEDRMNAVTCLSGSGPAYVFYLTEALADAGKQLGLSEDQAQLLARRTIIGAAELLKQSPDSPAELRRKVTSPGGFTEAAIGHLQQHRFAALVADALAAAEVRGKALSR